MTERADQLHATAEQQVTQLLGLFSALDEAVLRQQCPAREKLGDGTVAALAMHTAENYKRIGAFVGTAARMTGQGSGRGGGHQMPGFLRALGHRPPEHAEHAPGAHGPGGHGDTGKYASENTSATDLRERLMTAREALAGIGDLVDTQLDAIPPRDSFRFCDGQRSLEQVLDSLFKHQASQVRALQAAVS